MHHTRILGNCIKNFLRKTWQAYQLTLNLLLIYSVNNTEVFNFKTLTTFKSFKVALFYFVHCTKLLLNKYSSYISCYCST